MKNKSLLIVASIFALLFFAVPAKNVLAAKSPTPRMTEIAGRYTSNIRVHFQIKPIKAGQIIKVRYSLTTQKFNDVKYKIPKNAKKSGAVSAAASATGSAIDLKNLPNNAGKFIYNIKVRIKVPGKSWSAWSSEISM